MNDLAKGQHNSIVTVNDHERGSILKATCVPCSLPLDRTDQEVIDDIISLMDGEMKDAALGIAAVQVGYPKQIFVMRDEDGTNLVIINPEILEKSHENTKRSEGCLSIPEFVANPIRPKSVKLRFMNRDGGIEIRSFHGLLSRVVCHEIDHLNGKLLIDHMESQIIKHSQRIAEKRSVRDKRAVRSRIKEKRRRKASRKNRRK